MNNLNINLFNISSLLEISKFNIFFKIGFLLTDIFMIVFLLVAIRQVFSMNHIIHDSNDFFFIKIFSFALLFTALSLFLISIAIL